MEPVLEQIDLGINSDGTKAIITRDITYMEILKITELNIRCKVMENIERVSFYLRNEINQALEEVL